MAVEPWCWIIAAQNVFRMLTGQRGIGDAKSEFSEPGSRLGALEALLGSSSSELLYFWGLLRLSPSGMCRGCVGAGEDVWELQSLQCRW